VCEPAAAGCTSRSAVHPGAATSADHCQPRRDDNLDFPSIGLTAGSVRRSRPSSRTGNVAAPTPRRDTREDAGHAARPATVKAIDHRPCCSLEPPRHSAKVIRRCRNRRRAYRPASDHLYAVVVTGLLTDEDRNRRARRHRGIRGGGWWHRCPQVDARDGTPRPPAARHEMVTFEPGVQVDSSVARLKSRPLQDTASGLGWAEDFSEGTVKLTMSRSACSTVPSLRVAWTASSSWSMWVTVVPKRISVLSWTRSARRQPDLQTLECCQVRARRPRRAVRVPKGVWHGSATVSAHMVDVRPRSAPVPHVKTMKETADDVLT
jgi:hypothetical protein